MKKPELIIREFKDAVIQAFSHPLVAPPPYGFKGGLIIDDPEAQKLRHSRYFEPADNFDKSITPTNRLHGNYIYGGPIYDHFGHFMSEMVHRLVPGLPFSNGKKWLFVGIADDPRINSVSSLPSFVKEILQYIGIDKQDITIVNESVTVENLTIIEQGSDFGGGPKDGYTDMLADYAEKRFGDLNIDRISLGPVYISRRLLPKSGTFMGESYLESLLAEEGVALISPETYPFIEQMNIYRSASALVFPEGSACHGVELLGTRAISNCNLLVRRQDHREIFTRVLEPRSKEFYCFDSSRNLGSVCGPPGGSPWWHAGVSLLDMNKLVPILRERGIAKLNNFSADIFLRAALADIDHYIGENIRKNQATSLGDAYLIYDAFFSTLDEMNFSRID